MGQCQDDIKIPFPVVHSILIRRECISCIFWLVERQIRNKKLQLKWGWCVKMTSWITPYNLYSRGTIVIILRCLLSSSSSLSAYFLVDKAVAGIAEADATKTKQRLYRNMFDKNSPKTDYGIFLTNALPLRCGRHMWQVISSTYLPR